MQHHERLRSARRLAATALLSGLMLVIDPLRLSVGYAAANDLAIYLSHGIGDNTKLEDGGYEGGQSGVFSPVPSTWETNGNFRANPDGLKNSLSSLGNVYAPWTAWRDKDITAQAQTLSNFIANNQGDVGRIALIGHSQGGLRSRAYLQLLNGQPYQDRVTNLITLDSPNSGAPILNNTDSAVAEVGTTLAFTGSVFLPASFPIIAAGLVSFFGPGLLRSALAGAGGDDMRPQSAFIGNLNAPDCHWESQTTMQYFWWFSWPVTTYYQVCSGSVKNPIPANVKYLAVRGRNSDPDAYVSSLIKWDTEQFRSSRTNFGYFSAGSAALLWLISFWCWWVIPMALAWTNLANILLNFPSWYRNRVQGSDEGDAIVPYDSQLLQKPGQANIGGIPSGSGEVTFQDDQHSGKFSVTADANVSDLLKLTLGGL